MDKVYIPKKFFINMTKTHKSEKYVDSELVEVLDIKVFKGAMFELTDKDLSLLERIGLVNIAKKIYCKIELEINDTIEILDKKYTVTNARDYHGYADLFTYYLKRVDKIG